MTEERRSLPGDVSATERLLASGNYVAGRDLATVVYLALHMRRPLLLEGEAGVGKTEIAKVLADTLGRRLLRLQCYEGLDLAAAAYEWNYPQQMVSIRLAEAAGRGMDAGESLYTDEIDRADEPFEAFLLEILSDFQLTIPELGTVHADEPPVVVITSNRTREVHDALRRRCLYHWVEYPTLEAEMQILAMKAPGLAEELRQQLVSFIQKLRDEDLYKRPGVSESIDWAHALIQLDAVALTPDLVNDTLGSLLKYQDDIQRVHGSEAARLLAEIQAAA